MLTRRSTILTLGTLAVASVQAQSTASGATRSPATATEGAQSMDKSHAGMKDHADKSGATAMTPVTAQFFVTQAATTDMAEIELAKLAMKNGKDPAVKKFADQMVKDHTATSAKLKAIAAKENLSLPTALDPEHAAVKAKLASLQGEAFDAAYGEEMGKGHDKAVALFQSASQASGIGGELKTFATATLPKLREHQEMAHDLHGKSGA